LDWKRKAEINELLKGDIIEKLGRDFPKVMRQNIDLLALDFPSACYYS